jgi:hypothetical protein
MKPTKQVKLTDDEIQDLLSALSFFRSKYEKLCKQKAPITLRAMARLEKKIWKVWWGF